MALALLLSLASSSAAVAAINDDFANRIPLVGTNISVTSSNTDATKESGEPDHAGNPGGKSVWWTWTAPADGEVQVTTDGSSFDTLLAVYTGSTVSQLSLVASNDDHGVTVTSRVRFAVDQGTQYQIAIDGYSDGTNTDSGDIALALNFSPGPLLRPANDDFTNRFQLSGLPVITNAASVQATREAGEPFHAGKPGDTSIWFEWTAPSAGPVRVSTEGSTFDTLLAVYSGSSLTNLTEVASSDDIDPGSGLLQSAVVFESVAGQAFQIAVDGFDGAQGQVSLRIESAMPRLSSPVRLMDGSFSFSLTGIAGKTYEIQETRDFQFWATLDTVSNTTGVVLFTDPTATNFHHRFYRAWQQP